MTDLTSPIDPIHAMAEHARQEIEELFQAAKDRAAQWTPRPYPR